MEILKEKLASIYGGRILDVGTGVGSFIPVLQNSFKDYFEIIGIDESIKALEAAEKHFNTENIKFIKMSAEDMTFEDGSFDTVCISNSLHHLKDLNKVLNEMKRVLKKDGLFIINEMFCDNLTEAQLSHVCIHHLSAEIDSLKGIPHNKTFKKEQIISIAKELGLEVLHTLEYIDEEVCKDKAELDGLAESIDKMVDSAKDLPEYEDLRRLGEDSKYWIYAHGIQGATQLIVICKK